MPEGMKTCRDCHQVKPLDSFNRQRRNKDGHRSMCRRCDNARTMPGTSASTAKPTGMHGDVDTTRRAVSPTGRRNITVTASGDTTLRNELRNHPRLSNGY